ncbi:MAG: hypothetical protein ACYSW3_02130 [Planctomycetota bacterium]|jgi:ribosomal protein L24
MNINIGDEVWVAETVTIQKKITCPICNGNKEVKLTLGTGEEVMIECGYCKRGWEGPRGYIGDTYHTDPYVKRVTVESIGIKKDYYEIVSNHRVYYSDKHIAFSKDIAIEKAELLAQAQNEANEARRNDKTLKAKKNKSYAWNAGYHLKETKRHIRDAKYHREKARLCKAKVR